MALIELVIKGTHAGQEVVNVHHYTIVSGGEAALVDEWMGGCGDLYLACLSSAYAGQEVVGTNLDTHTQYVGVFTGPGTIVAAGLPPQAAGIITWRTAMVGRMYRGRTYMPAVPEFNSDDGIIDGTLIAAYSAYAYQMLQGMQQAVGASMVIYHKTPHTYTPVTASLVRSIVYTQRRRTVGRGS
jgi:hypothetical protein